MSNTRKPKSFKERLAAAKLPERSLQVCLRGDLMAEFEDLERQLREVGSTGAPARLGTKPEALKIAEKQAALRDQMADAMEDIRVRALPRPEWVALCKEHPPRDDHEGDRAMGGNLETLMPVAIRRCVVEPEMDDADWEHFESVLSSGDYDRLLNAVWDVNRSGVDVPKLRLASLVMAENGDASK